MLPRWLTALPRFAATWRDEIAVVALGLAYQAGVAGTLGAPRAAHPEAEQVVVRIAAEMPRVPMVTMDMTMERTVERGMARSVARTVEHTMVATRAMPAHVTPLRAMTATIATVPVAPARARVRAVRIAPASGTAQATIIVTSEAGENVAADLAAGMDVSGIVVDTFTMPEIRASIARARAAMDEARVRAALQKALAAERSVPRAFQGPGA
jgi:hypothetical protein